MRAAKSAASRSSTSSLSSNEEVTITVTTTTTPKDSIEKGNDSEKKTVDTEKNMDEKAEETKSENKLIVKDDKKTEAEEKKDLNNLDVIMAKVAFMFYLQRCYSAEGWQSETGLIR